MFEIWFSECEIVELGFCPNFSVIQCVLETEKGLKVMDSEYL